MVLFTDSSDERNMVLIQQMMKEGRLMNRYDDQLFAVKICPPGRRERSVNL